MPLTAEEFDEAAAEEREKRLTLVRAMRGKLAQALNAIKPGKMHPRDIIAGIRLVNDQSRTEFRAAASQHGDEEPAAAAPDTPDDPLLGLHVFRPTG